MMSAGITGMLFILLAAGLPVAFSLALSGAAGLLAIGGTSIASAFSAPRRSRR